MNSVNVNLIKSDQFGTAFTIWTSVMGLFLGFLIAVLPWWLVIGFCLGTAGLVIMARYPFWGIIFALALVFEAIPRAGQVKLSVVSPSDLVILYLTMIVFVQVIINGINIREKIGRLWWPLIYLFSCIVISLCYVKFFAPNKMAMAEGRAFVAWLLFPIILVVVNSKDKFKWLLRAVISISLIVSLWVILQSMLNIHIMSLRVEELDSKKMLGITRSIAGGGTYLIIFSLIYFINRLMEKRISKLLTIPAIFLLVIALAVTFGRGVWMATGVSIILSAYLFKGRRGAVFALMVAAFSVALLLSVLSVIKPQFATAIYERATGVVTEVDRGKSFNWRIIEDSYAIDKIEKHPFFGVGIGGAYKNTVSTSFITNPGTFADETRFIHNGYLFFPLKMGLFAALCPFAIIFGFVLTYRDTLADPFADRAFLAAVGGAFLAPVITSVTQPEWSNISGITAFAIFMSLLVLYRIHGGVLDTSLSTKDMSRSK